MSEPMSPGEAPKASDPGEQHSAEDLSRTASPSEVPGRALGWGPPSPGQGWTRRPDGSWDPPRPADATIAATTGADPSADVTGAMPRAQDDTQIMWGRIEPAPVRPDAAYDPGYQPDPTFSHPAPPPPQSSASSKLARAAGTHRGRLKAALALAAIFALGAFLGVAISNSFWVGHDRTATQFQPGNGSGNSGTLPFGNGGSGSEGSGVVPNGSGTQPNGSGSGSGDGSNQWPWDNGGGSNGSNGSSGSQSGPSNVSSIAAKVDPALVDINIGNNYSGSEGAATGIVLTSDGLVLTNNHVVDGATSITATDLGNGQTYKATVLGYDRSHDIALIKLSGASGLTTAKIASSSNISVGDGMVAIGNAGGVGGTPSAVGGTITALNQQVVAQDPSTGEAEQLSGMIQTNADIQSGDSGGPFVNTNGEVIGVTSVGSAGYSSFDSSTGGYAVPIDTAMQIVEQIKNGDSSGTVHVGTTAFLGVSLSSDQGGNGFGGAGSGSSAGATIADVVSGSPADKLGLTAGDVIVSVDGHSIDSAKALSTTIASYKAGDSVRVTWIDQSGSQQSGTVQLAAGPAD